MHKKKKKKRSLVLVEISRSSPPSIHVFIGYTYSHVKYMLWGVASTFTNNITSERANRP